MSRETCYACGKAGEEDAGGKWQWAWWFDRAIYTCAACVKARKDVRPGVPADCADYHDDRPEGRTDLHTPTQNGDLDTAGRPLKPGS